MKNPESCRVLYADYYEDAGDMMRVMLGFSGIEVAVAKTAAEAWKLAQTECFDLYLLDPIFPDGDGPDLCRRLREHTPNTPIIIYSGDATQQEQQKVIETGIKDWLIKPNFDNLAETILQTIEVCKQSGFKSTDNFSRHQNAENTAEHRNENAS